MDCITDHVDGIYIPHNGVLPGEGLFYQTIDWIDSKSKPLKRFAAKHSLFWCLDLSIGWHGHWNGG